MSRHPLSAVTSAVTVALLLEGCAALPIAAVIGPLLEAGGGALVKTGTEYTASGTARRTFAVPITDVHAAVLEALRRTDLALKKEDISSKGQVTLVGDAEHRKVRIRLLPLTRELTSMELAVKRNILASDKATASELLAVTERVLAENPTFAPRLVDTTVSSLTPPAPAVVCPPASCPEPPRRRVPARRR